MRNSRLRLDSWTITGARLLFRSRRLLSGIGVGLAAIAPQGSHAARTNDRRDETQAANRDERRYSSDTHENRKDGGQNRGESDRDQGAENKADTRQSADNADERSRKQSRDNDGDRGEDESANGSHRQKTQRQDAQAETNEDSGAKDTSGDGGSNGRVAALEQRTRDAPAADVPTADTPAPAPAPVAPVNPNVGLGGIPDTTDAELVVQANPDVIAGVSTSGGFAFARSGGVTAVTGPDGARIIQTGESGSAAPPPPREPSADGGNNDMEFTS